MEVDVQEQLKETQQKYCELIFKENWDKKEDTEQLKNVFNDIKALASYWHIPYQIITKNIYSMDASLNYQKIRNSITERFDNAGEISSSLKEDTLRHVELAIIQKEYIDKNMLSANSELKEINNELEEIQDTKSKIYTDFITILGIFTAITFAIFGGLQLIGNCLSNLKGKITLFKIGGILIVSSVILLSVYLILMALMVGLSKLISRSEEKRYKFTVKVTTYIICTIIGLFIIGCVFVFL